MRGDATQHCMISKSSVCWNFNNEIAACCVQLCCDVWRVTGDRVQITVLGFGVSGEVYFAQSTKWKSSRMDYGLHKHSVIVTCNVIVGTPNKYIENPTSLNKTKIYKLPVMLYFPFCWIWNIQGQKFPKIGEMWRVLHLYIHPASKVQIRPMMFHRCW
jgi:bifunctional pyridoxal-dependent enzyme with beta-cystathionase and maltose regulon repressor activities